jgi:ligand-binding SRPBCC domain-containing protein
MPLIHLTSFIAAPPERVFDLSRHVSVHKHSMSRYNEKVIQGIHAGLMELNDEVKWQARHLFKNRYLKVRITALQRPRYFQDEMVEGDFKSMKHEHYFKPAENGTFMIDQFHYELPYGWFGKMFSNLFFENYIKGLLITRNDAIRQIAESNQWKQYLTA